MDPVLACDGSLSCASPLLVTLDELDARRAELRREHLRCDCGSLTELDELAEGLHLATVGWEETAADSGSTASAS
ncbi:MAG: hypothetical protein AAF533_27910 [Acidobacteriota bacterium]